jgi:hypothetical protein
MTSTGRTIDPVLRGRPDADRRTDERKFAHDAWASTLRIVASLATASLDAAERRALQRFVGHLQERFAEDLDAVWLYGPRVHADGPHDGSELRLFVLLRDSSRSDRVTALELLWQAAVAERATESYFSIKIADRSSAERRRAIDRLLVREVEPDGIALFTSS